MTKRIRTWNSEHVLIGDGLWQATFHSAPMHYRTAKGLWRPLSEIAPWHGNHRIVLDPKAIQHCDLYWLLGLARRQRAIGGDLSFGYPDRAYAGVSPFDLIAAATLTKNPDPDPESTSVDGYVINSGVTGWDAVHDATSGLSADDSSTTLSCRASDSGIGTTTIHRGFTLFDTSSLGAGASVSAATVSLYATAKVNTDIDGDDWINVVQSSPASNTALVAADFDQCGAINNPTEGATRIDIGSIATSAYNDWTLNATGLTWVSKTGLTKLGWREGHDATDAPIGTALENSITCSSADASGTSQDPKLVVTYTLPFVPRAVMVM